MKTRRNRSLRRRGSRKSSSSKKNKSSKRWVTAISAAQKTLTKTGDIVAARKSLRRQALTNARKLFGSITTAT
jgi:hypothetical protein